MATEDNAVVRYGCAFCRSGSEDAVARQIGLLYSPIFAFSVYQEKHKSTNGNRSIICERILPGYVFFATDIHCPVDLFLNIPALIRVLRYSNNEWMLDSLDEKYAKWIIDNEGIIRVSEAKRIGDNVVFTSGYLKNYRGNILKIDKHNRNCLTQLVFGGVAFMRWIPFVFVDN